MSDTPEVKPCPFCGGEAAVNGYAGNWLVLCQSNADCQGNCLEGGYLNEDEAIAAWNTRTPTPEYALVPVEPTEEMRDRVDNWLIDQGLCHSDATPFPDEDDINALIAMIAAAPVQPQTKLAVSKEWCMEMAKAELECGAGVEAGTLSALPVEQDSTVEHSLTLLRDMICTHTEGAMQVDAQTAVDALVTYMLELKTSLATGGVVVNFKRHIVELERTILSNARAFPPNSVVVDREDLKHIYGDGAGSGYDFNYEIDQRIEALLQTGSGD